MRIAFAVAVAPDISVASHLQIDSTKYLNIQVLKLLADDWLSCAVILKPRTSLLTEISSLLEPLAHNVRVFI